MITDSGLLFLGHPAYYTVYNGRSKRAAYVQILWKKDPQNTYSRSRTNLSRTTENY